VRATNDSEPESAALVEGSIWYGRGDFARAISCYAQYVEHRWDDVDAWRLLAAALRRAGQSSAALAIAFNLDELQHGTAGEMRTNWGGRWPWCLNEVVTIRQKTARGRVG
jgi:Flp pilus assembly protein TadD